MIDQLDFRLVFPYMTRFCDGSYNHVSYYCSQDVYICTRLYHTRYRGVHCSRRLGYIRSYAFSWGSVLLLYQWSEEPSSSLAVAVSSISIYQGYVSGLIHWIEKYELWTLYRFRYPLQLTNVSWYSVTFMDHLFLCACVMFEMSWA